MKKGHRGWPEPLIALDPNGALAKADRMIVEISRELKILRYINPTNTLAERDAFFASQYRYEPRFAYVPLRFDPEAVRRELARIPIDRIRDPGLARLYAGKRDELRMYLDLVEAVGTPRFREVSVALFGPRPAADGSPAYLEEARQFVSLQPEIEAATLTPQQARTMLEEGAAYYARQAPFRCQIKIREHLSANAAAGEQSVVIRDKTYYTRSEILAVSEHEISVHVLTAHNGFNQPLKIFGVGLPGYLQDQEGYAIFSEYMRRFLTPNRLRVIGGRSFAVDMMLKGSPFSEAFATLVEAYQFDLSEAFSICERAYRGGGYTKDSIYFQGFIDVFKAWIGGMDLATFSLGKMSIQNVPYVARLLREGILRSPRFLPRFMVTESLEARRALFRLFSREDVKDFYFIHSQTQQI